MAIFDLEPSSSAGTEPPSDPKWVRAPTGRFHRLVRLDPEEEGLEKLSGIYVLWHAGVKPAWVFVGRSADLAATFHQVADQEEIMEYDIHGGLFVTWSLIRKEYQDGVVRHLIDTLSPEVENPLAEKMKDVEAIPVLAPGIKGDGA